MEIITNILFLSVSVLIFLSYRQGIKDGAFLKEQGVIPKIVKGKKNNKLTEEEQDLINQYQEILNYDFDKAGERNE